LQATSQFARAISLALLGVLVAGCSSGPSALRPPELDPAAAAEEALSMYDTNQDGKLDSEELKSCPGLLAAIKSYDVDNDGMISQEEIAARLAKFVERGIALSRLSATVKLDKRPLAEATIRLVPEPYLGEEIMVATGTTRGRGSASMAVPDADLPENQKGIRGIHGGTYRVEITHPSVEIPEKYNTQTTLGYETTPGNPYVTFELRSR